MAIDFKPYYDKVLAAQAELNEVINTIDAAMNLGTPEGEKEALELEPLLDEAKDKAEKAQAFYAKMVEASKATNLAKNFVPVSETPANPEEDKTPKVMNRAAFAALSPSARMEYVKSGGTVED